MGVGCRRIPCGMNDPTMTRETLTVEDARRMLGHNTHNRNPRGRSVHRYARDMRAGRWAFTGDPIRFDTRGVLLDGQCRLLALVEAGETDPHVSLDTLVVRGLPPAVQAHVDLGARRSLADRLRLRGEHDCGLLASTVMLDASWERTGGYAIGAATHMEALAWLDAHHDDLTEAARRGRAFTRRGRLLSASCAAVLWLRFARKDRMMADLFTRTVADPRGLDAHDPRLILNDRLAGLRALEARGVDVSMRVKAGLAVKAWNLWRAGATCDRLEYRPGGAVGEAFPHVR